MNPVALIKALLIAGLFAIVGSWAFTKVTGQAGALTRYLP